MTVTVTKCAQRKGCFLFGQQNSYGKPKIIIFFNANFLMSDIRLDYS